MNFQEARTAFMADVAQFESLGAVFPDVTSYIPTAWKKDHRLAFDAQPALATAPNSSIPTMLTTMIDPAIYEILFAPLKAAEILGEVKKGDWTDQTAMFPTVEHTGEVSSYGDYSTNGSAGANTNFPQRQSYLYQTVEQYGELEVARAGVARINWISELNQAAARALNTFQNYTYFFGVQGLQNYGLLNDPNLSGPLTPAPKAFGNNRWITNGVITATANEIYADIQSLLLQLIQQTQGLVNKETPVVLALSPGSEFALTATNSFNVNVNDLLKKNIPNIRIVSAVQYGVQAADNPQGVAAGNFVQMIAETVGGQQTGYCAFNEKMRSHPLIRDLSSWKQKMTAGTWGAIIRQPFAISSMIGI